MLPFEVRWLSPNESSASPEEEADALLSGSSESSPPTPEQEQETPEETQAVPYDRFKQVNDQLREYKKQLDELKALKPVADEASKKIPADEISKAVAAALKEVGIDKMAHEVQAVRMERVRERTMSELRQMQGFNEQRDLPRIVETMKAKNLNAVDAFKLIQFDAPRQAPVAHDAQGRGAASVEDIMPKRGLGNNRTQMDREAAAVERMKKVLANPSMKKALELP